MLQVPDPTTSRNAGTPDPRRPAERTAGGGGRVIDRDADSSGVSWSEAHDAYTTRFDDEDGGYSPSVAVAEALEAALDGGGKPLFEYVDPDALDALVDGPSETTTVSFDVESATVTVHSEGRVFVRP